MVLLLAWQGAAGQYYNNGAPPASQRWEQLKTDSLRIIYPREFAAGARSVLHYMDTVRPYINHGFSRAPLKTPVVINTENFYANGLSILAPKRIELGGIPAINTYSTPWLKQLSVHEYRHMVQYGNINRSTVRVLSYIGGQQISLLSTGLLPFWFIEGDATYAETQFSEFGRGLQPSFTMQYRALGEEITARRNPDKWFSGSYIDYVPSHYDLGYQLVAHSERKYGKYIWDDVARYSSDFPFLLFTTQLALRKYYDTSTKGLFHETFGYLTDYWDSLPAREDSAEVVAEGGRTYTTYKWPLFLDDNTLLALKTDYDRPQRFVKIDLRDNSEEHLCYTGSVSTRPEYMDGKVYWTEYRGTMWEQRTNSVLCRMEEGEWNPRRLSGERAALYATPVPGHDTPAYVKYHYEGRYTLETEAGRYAFPHGTEIQGLAYDAATRAFYFIALDDDGMRIGAIGEEAVPDGGTEMVIKYPSRATLSDLRAEGGKLYFGSTASGYDEAHSIDLASGEERRVSASRYGSFSPAPSGSGERVAMTVYDRRGYKLGVQDGGGGVVVEQRHLPDNVVNPPVAAWDVPSIDGILLDAGDLAEPADGRGARRYRKALNLFNFHSWAPVDFDPSSIINSFDFNDIRLGVMALSQNLLSTALTSVGYGYGHDEELNRHYSAVRANFKYNGLAPKFELNAVWSDSGQRVSFAAEDPAPPVPGKSYLTLSARTYLPLVFAAGYHTRTLTPNIQYVYHNNIMYHTASGSYKTGQHLLAGSLSFGDNVRRARLQLIPRWSYLVRGTIVTEPARNRYATTTSLYGRIQTPGLFRNHGLSLAAAWQKGHGKGYTSYSVVDILPRGCANFFPDNYAAVSANYYFPIAYPDWGWSGVFFLKRIHASVGGDYAVMKNYTLLNGTKVPGRGGRWSWGGTLRLDIGFLRLPSQGTCTAAFGIYVPSDTGKVYFTTGFSIPL